ncbi:hypothetical protein VNI00_013692 [Paramarasmius palmivorus]|uniref:GDP/GTP exchange factor Sec2 N-terminal domain-containing protein n=1 Tax=Paramarasmius palmivorus TaxID=297713 RepID=A0AAW0BW03_9AGAR
MLHFPSTYASSSQTKNKTPLPKRTDSLNATQHKSSPSSNPLFLKIEEELHDARRVQQHGQEDDLRMALGMVIGRVTELTSLLNEAYKTNADLEVQLNVSKSNLQLVISNNEMLEEALKASGPGSSKDVGWRRWSAREAESQTRTSTSGDKRPYSQSVDLPVHVAAPSPAESTDSLPTSPATGTPQESRFFKFRFNSSSSNISNNNSRPGTPVQPQQQHNGHHHLASASMTSLHISKEKEIEELTAELDKERQAKKDVMKEKEALEAELESLSQALFEEANKMVAQERIKRAESEEELKEARQQKEALKSALRLVEQEMENLRSSSGSSTSAAIPPSIRSISRSRSSSEVGLKSPPLSRSPSPVGVDSEKKWKSHPLEVDDREEDADQTLQATTPKQIPENVPLPDSPGSPDTSSSSARATPSSSLGLSLGLGAEEDPWADAPSSSSSTSLVSSSSRGSEETNVPLKRKDSQSFYAAAYAMRMA